MLAVDAGLHCGFALYGDHGRMLWHRSQNLGSRTRLRRGAAAMLDSISGLSWLVVEGCGALEQVWEREAARRNIGVMQTTAEIWRPRLLLPREQRKSQQAKRTADILARRVIEWSNAARPTSLRHDAAEAVLIGLWGVLAVGWLDALPPVIARGRNGSPVITA